MMGQTTQDAITKSWLDRYEDKSPEKLRFGVKMLAALAEGLPVTPDYWPRLSICPQTQLKPALKKWAKREHS